MQNPVMNIIDWYSKTKQKEIIMSYIIIGIAALIIYPLLSIAAIQEKAIFIRSTIVSILGMAFVFSTGFVLISLVR